MRKNILQIGVAIIITWVTMLMAFMVGGVSGVIGWMITATVAAIGFVVLLFGVILK